MDQKPPSPSTSPNSSSSSSNSSSSNNNNNGTTTTATTSSLPPLTPKSIPSPNPNLSQNPYPTTFIQADTQSFKQVVQMLTGSAETTAKRSAATAQPTSSSNPPLGPKNTIPPISKGNKKPAFKLYERRSSMKNLNLKMISPLIPNFQHHHHSAFSPRKPPEILSPSILDFPSLVLSPVTPLSPDPFNRSPHPAASMLGGAAAATASAEDRAIAEKGFYLHPSPRDAEPPKLLPLFPLSSPRMGSASASASAERV